MTPHFANSNPTQMGASHSEHLRKNGLVAANEMWPNSPNKKNPSNGKLRVMNLLSGPVRRHLKHAMFNGIVMIVLRAAMIKMMRVAAVVISASVANMSTLRVKSVMKKERSPVNRHWRFLNYLHGHKMIRAVTFIHSGRAMPLPALGSVLGLINSLPKPIRGPLHSICRRDAVDFPAMLGAVKGVLFSHAATLLKRASEVNA